MTDGRARARTLLEYLAGRRDQMVELLVELASLESPTVGSPGTELEFAL